MSLAGLTPADGTWELSDKDHVLQPRAPRRIQGLLGLKELRRFGRKEGRGTAQISVFLLVFMSILFMSLQNPAVGVRKVSGASLLMEEKEKWREKFI